MKAALAFSWLNFGVRGGGVVALAPAIFSYYNMGEAHAWFEILTFYQLFLLLDLGFLPVLSRYYAYVSAESTSGDLQSSRLIEIDCFIISIYRVVSVVSFLVSFICVVNFSTYFKGDYWFSLFFSVSTAFYIYGGRYRSKIEGLQFVGHSKKIELIYSMIQLTSCFVLLLAGMDFIYVIITYYATSFVYLALLRWTAKKLFGLGNGGGRAILPSYTKIKIAKDAVKNGVAIISSVGLTQALTLIVSKKSSLEDASAILFCLILLRQIINFSQMPFYVSLPALAKQFAERKGDLMRGLAFKGYCLFLLSYLSASALVFILEPYIVDVLNKDVIYPNGIFWAAIVLAFFVERTFSIYQQYLAACDRVYWHFTNPASAVVMLASFVFLMPYYNYYALPMAIVLAYLMAIFGVILLECRRRYEG